ncbi:3-phosphoinositide-dependent protein kinase 1 [Acropora cervicornis]|uniref:3-phosphoinositide-dependent protein kinase 1 n=1 Tax=Acropora cervicornis TaxID=6130 RepID=A0AAD9Q9M5_ACRCE|nr:3-phosphoinositide-dependent protein kinase 1 [Acropora cervicornis]
MAENGEKVKATPNSSSSSPQSPASPSLSSTSSQPIKKKRPEDFKFGKILGEGSFSTVYVVWEISTGKEYAMKVLEKRHMIREKKTQYVTREKEVLSKLNHPFFVRLYFTFQDKEKLCILSWAETSDIHLGSFDLNCSRFYSAEVVSALEHLHGLGIIHSSDLWALGCIIYQLLSGLPPFRASNEYQIFKKIIALDYDFPSGFPEVPKDLVLDPTKRLGCDECGGFPSLKSHKFYEGVKRPASMACVEGSKRSVSFPDSDEEYDEFDEQLLRKVGLSDEDIKPSERKHILQLTDSEREERLLKQERESPWHQFVENNLILKTGGLFPRRRQLILTDGPHLYYVDAAAMVLKGEIPWTKDLRPEAKNFEVFFVHTPKRIYYLEDHTGYAMEWVKKIEEVHRAYFGDTTSF